MSSRIATLEPSGYVTAANVNQFEQQLTDTIVSDDYCAFLIDMEKVELLDSAGLMALVSAFRLAQQLGKRFGICSVSPSVRMIFELTQLDRIVDIFESRDDFDVKSDRLVAA